MPMENAAGTFIVLVFMVLAVLLGAFGGFFFYLGMKSRGFDRQIAAQGLDAEARVTDKHSVHAGKNRTFYLSLEYTTTPPGGPPQTLTQDALVSRDDYDRLEKGDTLGVRYLPDAPKEMIIRKGARDQLTSSFTTAGVAGLMGGAAMLALGVAVLARWIAQNR
jgi:hypothetical protein